MTSRPLALCLLLLAACGESPEASGEDEGIPVDTSFAEVVADLHLADARAENQGEPRDSLRRVALERHGLDSTSFARQLSEHTQQPEDVSAFYGAVYDLLSSRPTTP